MAVKPPVIFGSMDGLTVAMGLVAGLSLVRAPHYAIWTAALSGGLAEFPGMAAGQWKSAREDGWLAALSCGLASTAGAVAPALPFIFLSGDAALAACVVIACAVAGLVAWLSPEHGWAAVAETYGILIVAAGLCLAGSLLVHSEVP